MRATKSKIVNYQVRVEEETKDKAEAVAMEQGFDNLASAVRYFMRSLASHQISSSLFADREPSDEAIKRLDVEARQAEADYAQGRTFSFGSAQALNLHLHDYDHSYEPVSKKAKIKSKTKRKPV